jgi:biotin carboxyl carrier protein
MGKKKKKSSKKQKKKKKNAGGGGLRTPRLSGNVVPEAFPGCHVVHDPEIPPWVLEDQSDPFDPDEFGLTPETEHLLPQISIDPESRIMCLTNHSHAHRRSFFITLGHRLQGRGGAPLSTGHWRDAQGERHECTTIVAVLQPRRLLEICTVDPAPLNRNSGSAGSSNGRINGRTNGSGGGGNGSNGGDSSHGSQGSSGGNGSSGGGARASASSSCDASALDLYSTISDIVDGVGFGEQQQQQQRHQQQRDSALAHTNKVHRPPAFPFPLGGAGPFLCSQGACGCFTHFYSGTMHAIDLSCPVGTPVLAVGAGTIVEVKDSTNVSGIHASHLFEWNSIMLRVDEHDENTKTKKKRKNGGGGGGGGGSEVASSLPASVMVAGPPSAPSNQNQKSSGVAAPAPPAAYLAAKEEAETEQEAAPIYVEYVHIASGSAVVKVGDVVRQGDLLCRSGDVGFCPTPHLHIQVHRDARQDAPTAPFCFFCKDQDTTYVPSAGRWYSADGPVQRQDT